MNFGCFLKGALDRLSMVAGALIGTQIPEFFQQYTQRLSGHEAELHQQVGKMTEMASLSGKNLDQYLAKFMSSSDPDFAAQGVFMKEIVTRWEDFHQALAALTHAPIWSHPYYFFKYLNYPIAKATYQDFQPAINLSFEGLAYASVGIVISYSIYLVLSKIFSKGYTSALSRFRTNH